MDKFNPSILIIKTKKKEKTHIENEEDYAESFANIQASLEEQEKMEKKMKKAQKSFFR